VIRWLSEHLNANNVTGLRLGRHERLHLMSRFILSARGPVVADIMSLCRYCDLSQVREGATRNVNRDVHINNSMFG